MQKTKNKLGKLALFATSLSLLGSSLMTGSITPVLAEGESFRLDEVISTYAPFPESEEDAWQSDTDCCCYINYLSGQLAFRTAGGVGYISPDIEVQESGDNYTYTGTNFSFTLHMTQDVLSSIEFQSGLGKWNSFVGIYEPKEELDFEIDFNVHTTQMLNRLATKLGDTEDDWRLFVNTWVNDPTENFGLNYFNTINSDTHVFTEEDVRQIKNFVYYEFLLFEYLFDAAPLGYDGYTIVDNIRNILDHIFPLREGFQYFLELDYESLDESAEIKDAFENANELFGGTLDLLSDLGYDFYINVFISQFKNHLIRQSRELVENPDDLTPDEFYYKNICERIQDLTLIPWDYVAEMYNSYATLKADGYVSYVFDGNERIALNSDTYMLFAFVDLINTLFYEFDIEDNIGLFMISYFSPLAGKVLDYVESARNNDMPNVKLMAIEIIDEITWIFESVDYDRFEKYQEVEVSNNIRDGFDYLDELLNKLEAEEIDAVHFTSKLSEYRITLDELMQDVRDLKNSEGLTAKVKFLTRKVAELNHKFEKIVVDYHDLIIGETYLDYVERAIKAFNEAADCLDVELTIDNFNSNLAEYNSKVDEVIAIGDEFSDIVYNLEIEDLEAFALIATINEALSYLDSDAEAKYQGFINSKHEELSKETAVLYARLDDLDAAYKLDDSHLRDYYNAVNEVLNDLNELTIKAGKYKEVFVDDEAIAQDAELINLTYAKGQAILGNIQGRQEQYAIESIVSRGNGLVSEAETLLEQEGNAAQIDVLIERINSVITEIDDNFEALEEDERLTSVKASLSESINKLNNAKKTMQKEHTRNVVLIIVGSVVGAALFFVAGFFGAKLISKKHKKEA